MIAEVRTIRGPAAQGEPSELAQRAMKETRAADGCEGLYVLTDSRGGDGIAITVWRDEAAMNAMRAKEDEHIRAVRAEAPELAIGAPKVYQVATSL